MDTVLLIGNKDPKLEKFLGKLGYGVKIGVGGTPLPELVAKELFDLVVVDSQIEMDPVEVCEFIRSQENTRRVPIVFLSAKRADTILLKAKHLDKVEIIDAPYTIGALASKIATELRLFKMNGAVDDAKVSRAEMNASLRDLTARFTKELDDARGIQTALLPKELPTGEAFQIARLYKPLEDVGGDWYFAREIQDGKISAQIADVTGHGISAALIGSMTKLALFASPDGDPGVLLTKMNAMMAPHMPSGRFVTVASLVYNPADGELLWARAGHPPALHVKCASQSFEELKGEGFAVGFFEDSEYAAVKTTLNVGDFLVVITDGIPEAQNRGKQLYGMSRIAESLLKAPAETSAEQAVQILWKDFLAFMDGRLLKDDVTVIVLKRLK